MFVSTDVSERFPFVGQLESGSVTTVISVDRYNTPVSGQHWRLQAAGSYHMADRASSEKQAIVQGELSNH